MKFHGYSRFTILLLVFGFLLLNFTGVEPRSLNNADEIAPIRTLTVKNLNNPNQLYIGRIWVDGAPITNPANGTTYFYPGHSATISATSSNTSVCFQPTAVVTTPSISTGAAEISVTYSEYNVKSAGCEYTTIISSTSIPLTGFLYCDQIGCP